MNYQGTSITEPATYRGAAGEAWRVRMPEVGKRALPDHDGTVDTFIVRAPGCHVFWSHWMVIVVHLRPIPGVKPAHVKREGATHELLILALNPEQPLPPLDASAPGWRVHHLTPIDVAEQFVAANDAIAARICELAVLAIVDGVASPDQDWRRWWSLATQQTAQHFAAGVHTERLS